MISMAPWEAYRLYFWARDELELGNRVKAGKINRVFEKMMAKMSAYDHTRTTRMIASRQRAEISMNLKRLTLCK